VAAEREREREREDKRMCVKAAVLPPFSF